MRFTRRRLLASILFVVSVVAFLYFVLPKLLGLRDTWNRIQHGDPLWLALAAALEVLSFFGYIACSRRCSSAGSRGSTGARATRSRWRVWRRRGCSRRPAPAGSR